MTPSQEVLSEVTIFNKYAKYIPELQRRESWAELCTRNMNMHIARFPQLEREIQDVYANFVFPKKVLPSMRSLQFGGRPIELSNVRIFNCLAKETSFVTSEGVKSFSEFQDGDTATVLTHTGSWKPAVVKNFGQDALNKITFVRGRSTKIVYATDNHRWLLEGGKETTSLKVGDALLAPVPSGEFDFDSAEPFEKLYWCYGYVYGDGSILQSGNNSYSMVRLCGNEKNLYSYRFDQMQWKSSEPLSCGGDRYYYTGSYLKTPPDLTKDSLTLVKAFVNGYLCADGYKNTNYLLNVANKEGSTSSRFKSIQSSEVSHIQFLEKSLEMCGYFITNTRDLTGQKTNFGIRPETKLFSITRSIGAAPNLFWTVASIEKEARHEDVWCLEVEEDHSFILSGGLVTGNCSYLPIDDTASFSETMFLLLSGTGVGYGVQKHQVEKLPIVIGPNKTKKRNFLISDSLIGWADAVKILMKAYYQGRPVPIFDYRDIRPKGARLITSGGKAPGPDPLRVCLERLRECLDDAVGRKLRPIEAHDMLCHIADAVLSGGIRRAAMIALFSPDDEEMLTCKGQTSVENWELEQRGESYHGFCTYKGKRRDVVLSEYDYAGLVETNTLPWYFFEQQRGRANNSAVLHRGTTEEAQFKDIWTKVEASRAGEPGVFWTNDLDLGTNPCCEISLRPNQFCVSGDTKLLTKDGIETIQETVGREIEIWNGEKWCAVTPFQTGTEDQLFRVQFSDGSYLDATANHKFLVKTRFQKEFQEVETIQLMELLTSSKYVLQVPRANVVMEGGEEVEVAYDYGFVLGDGYVHRGRVYADVYAGPKESLNFVTARRGTSKQNVLGTIFQTYTFYVDADFSQRLKYDFGLPKEIFSWNQESILKFIAGWADADGSNASKGIRIYGREDKIRDAQLLLTKVGINSSVNLMSSAGEVTNMGPRKQDVWYLQITQTSEIPSQRLNCSNSEETKFKGKFQIIKSVTALEGVHPSYCLNEPELHQCVFGNVLTKQCNLTETNVSDVVTQQELNSRVKAGAFLGTLQAAYTDFHYLRPIWQETTEKEALIGVGMTGIGSGAVLGLNLEEAANVVKEENARIAALLGINPAARTTCVKPSGTTSLVVGSSSGIHAWHDEYYIRRMRVGKNEPLYRYMVENFPALVEDDFFKPHIEAVMSFPQKAPEGAILRSESYMDLLERVKRFNVEWVQNGHRTGDNFHNVSCTISLKDNEWKDCGDWMWENRDHYTGISVLPYDGGTYVQAPFETCIKEKYEELAQHLHAIDLTQVLEIEDVTDHKQEAACAGSACEISL